MDFISEKVHSLTGDTLSGINEMRRKKQQQQQQQHQNDQTQVVDALMAATKLSPTNYDLEGPGQRPIIRPPNRQSSPFGGDTIFSAPAPPIGFRVDVPRPSGYPGVKDELQAQAAPDLGAKQRQIGASDASLYEGDAWSRLWFQRVMILTLIRLLLFIRKIYEDYSATTTYKASGRFGHYLVSAAALLLPTAIFTIYRVSRYLQIALPTLRTSNRATYPSVQSTRGQHASRRELELKDGSTNSPVAGTKGRDEDEGQLRRALMGSPQHDDEGLVTARQTPTNPEEFHDSKSQQTLAVRLDSSASPAPSTAPVKDMAQQEVLKESVDIDKLGNIPDKESARIVIGTSEQLLHGVLFLFWQLKRQVDVMGYLVERSCLWRKPRNDEKEQLDRLRVGSDGLEWFQDFYAAFLAILAQVYTLGLYWTASGDSTKHSPGQGMVEAAGSVLKLDKMEPISKGAEALSGQLHTLAGALEGKDLLIMSELVVSSAVVLSLLVAVRRRDDGPLTLGLSMLGWGSIFASRIIIISLAFVHIGWKVMIPLISFHILGITGWIYKIAIDSHNGKASESEESKWNLEAQNQNETNQTIELNSSSRPNATEQKNDQLETSVTNQWTSMEHIVLVSQIFTLFALPSLFYWPIMFNLKLHLRPFKYLALILTENTILIAAIWFSISSVATPGQWYLLGAVGGFSILGFVFISLYISCKPSLTEYFARADELFNEAEKSGIYFEFCSRVFKMPDLSKHAFRRLMNQTEEIEVIDV